MKIGERQAKEGVHGMNLLVGDEIQYIVPDSVDIEI